MPNGSFRISKQGESAAARRHSDVQHSILLRIRLRMPDNDAWLLFSYVTHITRRMFLAERRARMDQEALERYEALLVRRAAHIPLQHLTGEQEFMGFPFQVNEHVLVPRRRIRRSS